MVRSSRDRPIRTWLYGLLLSIACVPTYSADFTIGNFVIEIPARFQGPITTKSEARLHTYAFSVPEARSGISPGLQIVYQENDLRGSQMAEADLSGVSQRYLANMLLAVERRRTEFRKGEFSSVKLAGTPGSEVSWTGRVNGQMNNGRLFCLANGTDVIFLHVMGPGFVPDDDMLAAIKAIQAMRQRKH